MWLRACANVSHSMAKEYLIGLYRQSINKEKCALLPFHRAVNYKKNGLFEIVANKYWIEAKNEELTVSIAFSFYPGKNEANVSVYCPSNRYQNAELNANETFEGARKFSIETNERTNERSTARSAQYEKTIHHIGNNVCSWATFNSSLSHSAHPDSISPAECTIRRAASLFPLHFAEFNNTRRKNTATLTISNMR